MNDLAEEDRRERSPSVEARLRRVSSRREIWFPAVVLGLFVLLVAGKFNGSSVAQLMPRPSDAPGVVLGEPRPIRSDEWVVRTPFVVAQEVDGLPRSLDAGVGSHDATLLYDLPTADWSMILRPHLWGYLFLPVEYGFAFDWWGLAVVVLLGAYALLISMGLRWIWAAVGAVLLYASPFLHWWYLAITFATIGYGCAAVAALAVSLRTTSGRLRWVLIALSVWLISCFLSQLYPPFQVPVMLVLGGWFVGMQWSDPRWRAWSTARPAIINLVSTGAAALVVLAAFVLTRSDAISAIAGTAYPGSRRVAGGDGLAGHLGSAWVGWNYLTEGEALRGKVFPNESEASSYLLVGVFALLGMPLVWPSVRRDRRFVLALIGLMVGVGVLMAHMYVSIPAPISKVMLLDRVQPARAVIGLGLAAVLALIMIGSTLERTEVNRWRRLAAGAVTAVFTGGYAWSLIVDLRAGGAPVAYREVALPMIVAVVVSMMLFWRPLVAALLTAAFGLVISLPVNPLVRGLEPLTGSPLIRTVQRVDDGRADDPPRWIVTGDGLNPLVTASGVDNLSAVNLYPDKAAWKVLDPTGDQQDTWNRYAHTVWTLTPTSEAPAITLLQPDVVAVAVDPCGDAVEELGVGHVISSEAINSSCLDQVAIARTPSGTRAFIYRLDP